MFRAFGSSATPSVDTAAGDKRQTKLLLISKQVAQEVQTGCDFHLTWEQIANYVLIPFMEGTMFKAVIQEAAALTSLALFVGMIAIWSQVLGSL